MMNVNSGLFVLILMLIIAFGGGYVFKSSQDTNSLIREQKRFLENQLVTIDGRLYRANRTTKTLSPCQLVRAQNSNTAKQYNCGEKVKVVESE